jgi:pimeloyl-ACP methyl ester carboxylesterase
MIEAEGHFDAISDAAIAQIRRVAKRDDVIHLVGYSFGGFVASEVARRLLAAGFNVGAIGLIDARRARAVEGLQPRRKMSSRVGSVIRLIMLRPRDGARKILWLAKCSFIARAPPVVLGVLHSLAMRLPAGMAVGIGLNVDCEIRGRALNNFTLSKLDHPATLFRSTEHIEAFYDNGWSDVCPQLNIVQTGGTHSSMFAPPHFQVLSDRLFETIAGAEAASPMRPRQPPHSASSLGPKALHATEPSHHGDENHSGSKF